MTNELINRQITLIPLTTYTKRENNSKETCYNVQNISKMEEGHIRQHMEGPHVLEDGEIWMDLGNKREKDIPSQMIETMHSMEAYLESIKANNKKMLKVKVDQDKINETLLKNLTENKQYGHVG